MGKEQAVHVYFLLTQVRSNTVSRVIIPQNPHGKNLAAKTGKIISGIARPAGNNIF